MVSSSLVTLGLTTIGAYAKPTVRGVGGLEVSLSTPTDTIASASDLRVVATVKNAGDEDLKILKPGTVLDNEFPTRSFIVSKDGKEVLFTGITGSVFADRVPENGWAVVPAGKTVTAEHNVSALYDFSASGPGTFTFDPVSTFQVIGLEGNIITISDVASTDIAKTRSVSITITDVSKRELNLKKSRQVDCNDEKKMFFIVVSVWESGWMAQAAVSYIQNRGADDQVYKDYFGNNPTSNVISNFNRIADTEHDPGTMSCSDSKHACFLGFAAYTVQPGNIHYCKSFFDQLSLDTLCPAVDIANLRGGTTLRELAHALRIGVDLRIGCLDSQKLDDPDKFRNSGNYVCFAAHAYHEIKCYQPADRNTIGS